MSAMATLQTPNQSNLTLRKSQPLRPKSSKDEQFGIHTNKVRRSSTIVGVSSNSLLNDLDYKRFDVKHFTHSGTKKEIQETLLQDENLGVKSDLFKTKFNELDRSTNSNLPGLYPRISMEERSLSNSLRNRDAYQQNRYQDEHRINSEVEIHSNQSFVTLISKNFHGLSTIKNDSTEEDYIYSSSTSENKSLSRKFTDVDLDVPKIDLLDDSEPLDLSPIKKRLVPYAGPFFQTIEFNPFEPTDTGILLKILNYEFEQIDKENDDSVDSRILETEKIKVSWIRKLISVVEGVYNDFLHVFKPLTKEEYNAKYPWDKFYDPELYFDNDMDEEGTLNTELIPDQLQGTVSNDIEESMKPYFYVSKRKGY